MTAPKMVLIAVKKTGRVPNLLATGFWVALMAES
jgi:hypothetical protein